MVKITVNKENAEMHIEGYGKDTAAESVLAVAALVRKFADTLGVSTSTALAIMISQVNDTLDVMEKVGNG